MSRPRIIILGGGFGGAYCAQALERLLPRRSAEVLLIDEKNYFVFYPLLVEAGTGSLEPRHAVVAMRAFLRETAFRMGRILAIDLETRTVSYRLPESSETHNEPFDHLVLALGSVTRLPDIPGLHEHCFEMKSMSDAVGLRDRAIRLLELADATPDAERRRRLLHFVVVGASFTGAEVAGEFEVFLREAGRAYANVHSCDCMMTLIEIGDRILPALDRELSQFALDRMRKRGIDVRLNTGVTEVQAERVKLSPNEWIDTHTVIWCAGIAAPPLLGDLNLPLDNRGYLVCDRDLRVSGHDKVWAIGDCAVNLDASGRPYPATAQHAVRQGAHLARNLARVLSGGSALPCDITSIGAVAALGCRTGVAKIFGMKLAGFPAWFLWRSVYLLKMPGFSRKLRIALDWAMDLVFKREYIQLGVHNHHQKHRSDAKSP